MQLFLLVLLTAGLFPIDSGLAIPEVTQRPMIVLFENGHTYSRICSEEVAWPEEKLVGPAGNDAAGNLYTIENEPDGEKRYSGQILKNKGCNTESLFAMLRAPAGHWGSFEAIGFDYSWNMTVSVTWGNENQLFPVIRDYYRIDGMPKSPFAKQFLFRLVFVVLIIVLILFSKNLLKVNLPKEPPSDMKSEARSLISQRLSDNVY